MSEGLVFGGSVTRRALRPVRPDATPRRARRFVVGLDAADRESIWSPKTATSFRLAFGQRSACGQQVFWGEWMPPDVGATHAVSGLVAPASPVCRTRGDRRSRIDLVFQDFDVLSAGLRPAFGLRPDTRTQGSSGRAYVGFRKFTARKLRGEAEPRRAMSLGRPDRSAGHHPPRQAGEPGAACFMPALVATTFGLPNPSPRTLT
jgi:hypothetical protein